MMVGELPACICTPEPTPLRHLNPPSLPEPLTPPIARGIVVDRVYDLQI